jgi:hypothetical protein
MRGPTARKAAWLFPQASHLKPQASSLTPAPLLLADQAQASGSGLAPREYLSGAHLDKPPLILTRLGEGAGELIVYFDPVISVQEKMLFSRYVFGVGTTMVRIACPPWVTWMLP